MSFPAITKIEAIPYSIPFSTFLRSGQQIHLKQANNVLVRVTTEDGTIGVSEAMGIAEVLGESQASIVNAVNKWLLPRIAGLAVNEVESIRRQLNIVQNNWSAKSAVDMAIHDAAARFLNVPLFRYLGGDNDKIPLTWIIGQGTIEEMVDEAVSAGEQGYSAFKIKIGLDPDKDVKVVHRIRKVLGDTIDLYVDANQAYTYSDAVWALPRMVDANISIVEDPVSNANVSGRRALANHLSVPMLGDECVIGPDELAREIDLGIIRLINVKPPRSGYIGSRRIVDMAQHAGLEIVMGTLLESDVGVLSCAHFHAASYAFTRPAELTYWQKMSDFMLTEPLQVDRGTLILPKGPGIGLEINEEKLAKHSVAL
jgi:L-Ala-D/L-Glu epimerase